jgi:signal peptidase I
MTKAATDTEGEPEAEAETTLEIEATPNRPGWARSIAEIPIIAALAVVIVLLVRTFLVQPFFIPSASMVPQLNVHDKILASRLSYHLHGIRRGDLIVFHAPPGVEVGSNSHGPLGWLTTPLGLSPRDDVLVKRVIGLPGETIQGKDGHVWINGRLLVEPYLSPNVIIPSEDDFAPIKIPPGHLWVMGDNRTDSEDSRYFGPIKENSVIGRAFVKVWPLTNLSFL